MGDNDNKIEGVDAKDVVETCEKLSAKSIEICVIILSSFIFVLLFADLIVIKWSDLTKGSKRVLVLFVFIFLLSIAILIFSILLRVWRAKDLIKKEKKKAGKIIALLGIILSFVLVVFSSIESMFYESCLIYLIEPCEKITPTLNQYGYPYNHKLNNLYNSTIINKDIRRKLEICPYGKDYIINIRIVDEFMMKFTIAMLDYFYFILFGLFIILLTRISDGKDGPEEKEKIFKNLKVESIRIFKDRSQSDITIYNTRKNSEEKNEIKDRNKITTNSSEPIESQERKLNK